MTHMFSSFDKEIWDFSNLPGNESLLSRTGSYSTLMRGGLFGKFRQEEVELELRSRRVDVLMLGSNPNAGEHQSETVIASYGTLPMQMATGMLGEQKWNYSRKCIAGWDFLVDSNEGWKYFRGLLADELPTLDGVAMANFIPWGSSEIPGLVAALDQNTLSRALAFCEDLNARLVALLKPKIVIVPTSFTNKSSLNKIYKTKYHLDIKHAQKFATYLTIKKKNFYHSAGKMDFNGFTTNTLHVAHPGYFARVAKEDRVVVSSVLGPVIRQALV